MADSVAPATQETVERVIRAVNDMHGGVRCNVAVYALALARTFGSNEFVLVNDGPSPVCSDHIVAKIGRFLYDASGPISRIDLASTYCWDKQKLETLTDRTPGGDAVLRMGGSRSDGSDVRAYMALMAAALADPSAGLEVEEDAELDDSEDAALVRAVVPPYTVQMAFGF